MVWYSVSSFRIYPHYLAYFNELAGGPKNAISLLGDSNIDWGQDLIGLRDYLDTQGLEDVILSYFGAWVDPADWGIRYQYLPSHPNIQRRLEYRIKGPQELVAISVSNLQGSLLPDKKLYHWFMAQEPIERIGYSIYVYDITDSAEAHKELGKIYESAGLQALADFEYQRSNSLSQ